ncbi:MAG: caspase family protein [Archangiaceae bacterium]|nr:caspase family protein [Archangiaceae bacterium]
MSVLWALTASLAASAAGAEHRLAVLAGSNLGDAAEEPLRFAESDARRMRDALVEVGALNPGDVRLVLGQDPRAVLDALEASQRRAAELTARGERVLFFFYFSGHGDDGGLHLSGQRLELERVRTELARVPAAVRLSLLDACRTGGRDKGAHRAPEFALALAPSGLEGTVELRAASAGEAAQESEELMGALFTHALLSGLRGAADVDGDGRVTLFELYAYAHRRTLMLSGAAVASQRASLDADLAGEGDLVLSTPSRAVSTLEIHGAPGSRHLVFALPGGAVLGEVGSGTLALPAGQFVVQRRLGEARAVAQVDLSLGGHAELLDGDFVKVSREELVARGGAAPLRPNQLEAHGGLEVGFGSAERAGLKVGAGFVRTVGPLELGIELGYLRGIAGTTAMSGELNAVCAVANAGVRWALSRGALSVRGGVEGRYSWASLNRFEADRLWAAGFQPRRAFWWPSVGPRLAVGGQLALGSELMATAELAGTLQVQQELDSAGVAHLAARPQLSLSLGVGHAF